MEIISKKYEHYNVALGKYISSKKQYVEEMKRQGMVSFEKGQQLAETHKHKSYKPYDKPSKPALSLIREIAGKQSDKQGKIKLSDREVDAMKRIGTKFNPVIKPTDLKGGWK